jgi:hypothetical protein
MITFRSQPDDPFSIGRGDLDPLHGGMRGGMLFDPMRGGKGPRFGTDPSACLPSRLPPYVLSLNYSLSTSINLIVVFI